jgi:hypothetical protein
MKVASLGLGLSFGPGLSVALMDLTPAVAGPFHAPGMLSAPAAIRCG